MKNTSHIPKSIGVIIDGNRRWAKINNVSVVEGHKRGYKQLIEFILWARDVGIGTCFAYVFSTENWNRNYDEVQNLMNLMRYIFKNEVKKLKNEHVRIVVVGQKDRLDEDIQKLITSAEEETGLCDGITAVFALSYGGRTEIVEAAQKLVENGDRNITEDSFADALWTKGMPDPDIIIRTGGERRLSNFLPWQSVYSELFFTNTLWPDFSKEEFHTILDEFSQRERRRGR